MERIKIDLLPTRFRCSWTLQSSRNRTSSNYTRLLLYYLSTYPPRLYLLGKRSAHSNLLRTYKEGQTTTSSFCISYFGSGTRQKPISSSYFKNVEITTSCEHPGQFATSRILLVSPKQEVNCHSSNIGSKQPCLVLFKLRLVLAACREKMDVRPSRLVLVGERAGTRVVSHPQLLVRTADTASGSTVPPCCQCKVLSQEKLELLAFAGCMIRSAGNAPVIFALLPMLISRAVSFIGPSQAN